MIALFAPECKLAGAGIARPIKFPLIVNIQIDFVNILKLKKVYTTGTRRFAEYQRLENGLLKLSKSYVFQNYLGKALELLLC